MVYQTETLEEIYVKPQLNPGNLVRQSQHYSYLISCLSPVRHEIQKLRCPWRPFSINVIIHCSCGEQIRANQSWQFVQHFCWAEGVTQGASDRVSPQIGNTQKKKIPACFLASVSQSNERAWKQKSWPLDLQRDPACSAAKCLNEQGWQMGLSLSLSDGVLQRLLAAAHTFYEARHSHNYVKDISSEALMCPQSATGIVPSTTPSADQQRRWHRGDEHAGGVRTARHWEVNGGEGGW